jgi:outer membrane murein-binding lipoprotein Lpp
MKNIRYMLVLVLLISGCEDMKMDRKVSNNLELQGQVNQLFQGCKKFCVNRHFAGNCNFQKWNKNDYTNIIT